MLRAGSLSPEEGVIPEPDTVNVDGADVHESDEDGSEAPSSSSEEDDGVGSRERRLGRGSTAVGVPINITGRCSDGRSGADGREASIPGRHSTEEAVSPDSIAISSLNSLSPSAEDAEEVEEWEAADAPRLETRGAAPWDGVAAR